MSLHPHPHPLLSFVTMHRKLREVLTPEQRAKPAAALHPPGAGVGTGSGNAGGAK